MRNSTLFVICLVFAGCSSTTPKLPEMNETWIPIFMESRSGPDNICRELKLPILKDSLRGKDDVEVRIWKFTGNLPLRAIVLSRVDGTWSGLYIPNRTDTVGLLGPKISKGGGDYVRRYAPLEPPLSGWESLWTQLGYLELPSLPDATQLENRYNGIRGGTTLVVEVNVDGKYRTYHHNDLDYQQGSEASKMSAIDELLPAQFEQIGDEW